MRFHLPASARVELTVGAHERAQQLDEERPQVDRLAVHFAVVPGLRGQRLSWYRSFHSPRASTSGPESLTADRESRSGATAMIATRGGPEL